MGLEPTGKLATIAIRPALLSSGWVAAIDTPTPGSVSHSPKKNPTTTEGRVLQHGQNMLLISLTLCDGSGNPGEPGLPINHHPFSEPSMSVCVCVCAKKTLSPAPDLPIYRKSIVLHVRARTYRHLQPRPSVHLHHTLYESNKTLENLF